MSYDAWLEAPYQEGLAASDAYVDWCEAQDLDPDSKDVEAAYEDWLQAADEDAALAAAEARAERLAEDHYEREDW